MFRVLLSLISLGSLVACGGSAGVVSASAIAPSVRLAAFDTLATRLEDLEPSPGAPAGGTAVYHGYVGGTLVPDGARPVGYVGDAVLTLDFDQGRLTGDLTNFGSASGPQVVGSATLTGGRVAAGGLSSGVIGSLSVGSADYDVAAVFLGTLLGTEGASLTGLLSGDLRADGDRAGSITGEVWAEN